jgi:WD40 repeat protein
MSENEFLNALKEEMPDDFGRSLLAQLKAEEKSKMKPLPATIWTVAAACLVTVLVTFVLFVSRMPNGAPLSTMQEAWQMREPITPENINLLEPLLTIGYGQAEAIALSPDNNTLAVGTSLGLYLHDAHNLAAEPVFLGMPSDFETSLAAPYHRIVRYIGYTEDGRLFTLLAKSEEITLYEWDEASKSFLDRFTLGQPWLIPQVVRINGDGTRLLLGTCSMENGMYGDFCQTHSLARIQLVDLLNGEDVFFRIPRRMSNAIATVNPDWTKIAFEEESRIKLYDLASGETQDLLLIGNAEGNRDQVMDSDEMHSLHFSPDGSKIGILDATTSPMDWWELSELEAEPRTVGQYGTSMYFGDGVYYPNRPVPALNPVTEQYLFASDIGLVIYDFGANRPSALIPSDSRPRDYQVSSDGQSLYTLDQTGLIRVWDWDDAAQTDMSLRYGIGSNYEFSISADGNLFSGGGRGLGFVYDISSATIQQTALSTAENSYLASDLVTVSPDGRYIAFSQNSELWVYDRHDESMQRISTTVYPSFMAFRPDGALLVFSYFEGELVRARLFTAEVLDTGVLPASSRVEAVESIPMTSLVLSPDGSKILASHCTNPDVYTTGICENRSLRVFDTYTWEEIRELPASLSNGGDLASYGISSDSQWLFLSYCGDEVDYTWLCEEENSVIKVWNFNELASSAEARISIEGLHPDFLNLMNIIPYADGSFLIDSWQYILDEETTGDFVPTAIFWELEANGDYRELRRIPMESVSFAPDGSYFLTSKDGLIELWGVPANIASGN